MTCKKYPTVQYILLLLILLAVTPVWAQRSYEPGYIITSAKDSIRGSIQEGTDADLSTSILFRRDGSTVTKYEPRDLIEFGFDNGRTFERKSIISRTEKGTDTLLVFAKNLVRGRIDLFVLRFPHRLKPDIFLTNNSTNQTVHLTKPEKREIIGKDGKKYSSRDLRYAGNLALIKGDSPVVGEKPIRYSQKKIKNDILKHNENFKQEYPITEYEEEIKYNYDFLVGIPIESTNGLHFRAAFYRNKTNVERTTNFSFMQGVIYHHWSEEDKEVPNIKNGYSNFRWQLLNIIPVGINYHGNSGIIQPYGYAGIGVAAGMLTDRIIENYVYNGNDKTSFIFLPTINVGLGVKVKMGNTFLVSELTPTINGVFVNLGLSI